MEQALMIVHVVLCVLMVAIVLLQKSSGDGFGLSSGASGHNLLSVRGSANVLTRATSIVAALLMVISLVLNMLAYRRMDALSTVKPAAEASTTSPSSSPSGAPDVPVQ